MSITLEIRGLDELYKRLETLKMLRGIRATVGNRVKYGPLVGSSRFQARVHRGRWTTDEQALREEEDEIRRDFEVAVQAGLEASMLTVNPLLKAAQAAVMRLQTKMATYPPSRGSYRRTGTYGRLWTTEVVEE